MGAILLEPPLFKIPGSRPVEDIVAALNQPIIHPF